MVAQPWRLGACVTTTVAGIEGKPFTLPLVQATLARESEGSTA